MLYIVLNRCTWFLSNSVLYQTASFRLGFAFFFISKMFYILNQSLFSVKAILLLTSAPSHTLWPTTLPQIFQSKGLAQNRNDKKYQVSNVLLSKESALILRGISCHRAHWTLNSNCSDQKLSPWKSATALDICCDSNGIKCISIVCVWHSSMDNSGIAVPIHPFLIYSPIGTNISGNW